MSAPLRYDDGLPLEPAPGSPDPRRAGWFARLVAGTIGLVALIGAAVFSVGGTLIATVGMLVVGAIAARRGRPLTRRASWLSAVVMAGAAIVLLLGVGYASMAPATRQAITHTMDSASVQRNRTPPPAWAERLAPGSAATSRAQERALGPGYMKAAAVWGTVVGAMIAFGIFSILIGTVGWMTGQLLALAATGRWIGGPGSPLDTV